MKKLLVMLSVLIATAALYALDVWPQRNFDPARTGRTPGVGDIVTPELKWSYFTGGSHSDMNLFFDPSAPAAPFVFIMGGHTLRKNISNKEMWNTGAIQSQTLLEMTDINDDGSPEIFTYGADRLMILDSASGQLLSSFYLQSTIIYNLADIDSDGDLELILRNKNTEPGYKAYEIAHDPTNPVLKWESRTGLPVWSDKAVFGDLDGNPATKEMIFDSSLNFGKLWILDASTGQLLRYRNVQLTAGVFSNGWRLVENLDGDPQEEFLFNGNSSNFNDGGSIQISVYDYVTDSVQWHYEYGFKTSDVKSIYLPESVADLDGDGTKEVVISVYNNTLEVVLENGVRVDRDEDGINLPNRWVTIILDAATGAVKGQIVDQVLDGLADVTGDGKPDVITKAGVIGTSDTQRFSTVSVYSASGGMVLTKQWENANANLIPCIRPMRENMIYQTFRRSACIKDFDGDGVSEIIAMHDSDGDGFANSVGIVQNGGALTHAVPLAIGEEMAFIYADGVDLVLSRNTGHVFWYKVGAGGLTSYATITTGGYQSEPIAFADKASPRILFFDGMRKTLVTNPVPAAPNTAPTVTWNTLNNTGQQLFSFDRDGTGNYGFIRHVKITNGEWAIELRDAKGGLIWQKSAAQIVTVPSNFVSGDFNGDGYTDIAYYTEFVNNETLIEARDGRTGNLLYAHNNADINTYHAAMPIAIPDITGDGRSDLFIINNNKSELLDGATGSRIRLIDTGLVARHGFAADLDGDGTVELYGNAMNRKRMLNVDNTIQWDFTFSSTSSYNIQLLNFDGIADIDNNPGLDVAMGGQYGDLSAYSGLDGTSLWKRCLYLGMAIDMPLDSFLTRVDCPGAKLSNIASGDIDGDGLEEFVAGSPDGYLYVVNSEDGTLAWSYLFDYAVGNPILADIDDDGYIEVVVGVADGYIYAIDQKRYTASFPVREAAVKNGKVFQPGTDIDTQEYAGSIGVAWSPVFKAKGYFVRIVDPSGAVISDTVEVLNGFSVIVTDADIVNGQTYYAEVRGYDDEGYYSDWSRGDGVTVNVPAMTSILSRIKGLFR
ncbi:MAG TPA: VCBS repeat-containing protein [bacterium]|nr:VCBS repeat-containing protein [bacterium]